MKSISWALVAALTCGGALTACGEHDTHADAATDAPSTNDVVSLYVRYGGAPTVATVVDNAVTGLLADCTEAPYFAVIGQPGHDSVDRLKACLRLQFTVALGGPGTYPGTATGSDGTTTYMCEDMMTAHAGLGIPMDVFTKFIVDVGAVLTAAGVSSADVTTIANALTPLSAQIVSSTPMTYNQCDGGPGTDAAGGGG